MDLEQKFDWKIQKLVRAYAANIRSPELALKLAEAYFQKGYYLGKGDDWFELAIERVSEAIDLGLVTSEACTLLANALYGRSEYDAAGEAYRRALELDPKNALACVGLGNLEKKRGDFQKARECFQRAAELTPDLWQAHYNLGGAYFQEARANSFQESDALLEKAIYHLIKALQLKPFENFVGNIQKDLGELFLHTRQYPQARRFFNRLLLHDKYGTLAHYYLGLTHYAMGKYNLAIQNFRNFLKSEPDNALAHARIGLAYLDLKEYSRSRAACQKALELDRENVLAMFTIGCGYMDERDYVEATRAFQKLLEMAPDYFPAYVELVKCYFHARNYEWVFRQLREEVKQFEHSHGYDGGRDYYHGDRGNLRRRIDVLLTQLRDIGQRAFPVLQELLGQIQTDSLRFQVWEELYAIGRRAKLEEVNGLMQEPARFFSRELGRTTQYLAQHLPVELMIQAFRVEDSQLKRMAANRIKGREEQGAFESALEQVRAEYLEFQGALVRALAVKGTPDAENFLEQLLDRDERSLRLAAAAALAYQGNESAIDLLEQEAEGLDDGPELDRVMALIRIGREKLIDQNKVIRLSSPQDRSRAVEMSRARREDKNQTPTSCAVCGRGQREVERMLAGSRLMICTRCIKEMWKERDFIRTTDPRDLSCSFCRKSIFEVDAFYSRKNLLMCNLCLELAMGVIEREEVEHFLEDFH